MLARLLGSSPVGVGLIDLEFRYLYVNDALAAMNGRPAAEHLGRTLREMVPTIAPAAESLVRTVAESGAPVTLEFGGEAPGLEGPRRLWVSYYPVRGADGAVAAVGALVADVTEHWRTEANRERLLRETQEAVRARDEFLAVASHELKTPLTALRLKIDHLARTAKLLPAESIDGSLASLAGQARRLAVLVERVLDVSRIRAGQLELEREELDLGDLARDVASFLAPEAERAGCAVSVLAEGPATGLWDRARLEQVVTNLLANAIKFGAGRPVELHVSCDETSARLGVRDEGIGIPPDRIEHLFRPFERAVSARSYGGLGLGLYVARELVEAHGGSIAVATAVGGGTRFLVDLPRRVEDAADVAQRGR